MISEHIKQTAHEFLTNYLIEKNGFSAPNEDQPRLALFEIENEAIPDVLGIIFAVSPKEDIDNPSPETKLAARECLSSLREQHPELAGIAMTIDYTN